MGQADRAMRRLGIAFGVFLSLALSLPVPASAATNPALAGSLSSNGPALSGVISVAVSGHYAYTTAYIQGELTAIDISDPANPVIAGSSASNNQLMNGGTVNVVGGYAYVASKNRNASANSNDDGSGDSLTVLDIHTNPAVPAIVGTTAPDPTDMFGAYGVAVSGTHAFVAAQGLLPGQPTSPDTSTGSFDVIDVSNPGPSANPATLPIVATIANPTSGPFTGALDHACSVTVSGNYAYVTAFLSHRLTVIDISNPLAPQIVASLPDVTNLLDPADVAVSGHYAYVADQISPGRVTAVDISSPSSPKVVASLADPALNGAYRIRLRGNFAYVSSSSASTVATVDLSNPLGPIVAATYFDSTRLNKTTGLDLDATARYVVASSPYLSNEQNFVNPPFPGTHTGTISAITLDPSPISVAITPASEPPNPTNQITASFSFAVSDSVATVLCGLDGAPLGLCTTDTTQQYGSLGAGQHTFTVQATDSAGTISAASYTWTVTGTSPGVSPPQNTSGPTISGTPAQGKTLTVATGSWTGSPSFSYQWQLCDQTGQSCVPISGAASPTYTSQRQDVGATLKATVTGFNAAGIVSATSAATARVAGPPAAQTPPRISGTVKQGDRLRATNDPWTGYPAPSFAYSWQRCNSHGRLCKAIAGQTKTSYTVGSGDVGSTLRFVVLGSNSGGSSSSASVTTTVVSANHKAAAPAKTRHALLSGVGSGRPRLDVTLVGARAGAALDRVAIALPKGLRFSTSKSTLANGVTLANLRGVRLRFADIVVHGSLVLTLRHPASSVQVKIGGRAMRASRALAASVRKKQKQTLGVTITVTGAGARSSQIRLELRVA